MNSQENFIIRPSNGYPILADIYLSGKDEIRPVVIYVHGYKGFKDWGHLPLIPPVFNDAGMHILKFNFSHNGGTLDNPIDFPDLESFANNNLSTELQDLSNVIDWAISQENEYSKLINPNEIYLIGHSRGGGIAILIASRDKRVKKLVTWSAVSDFSRRLPNTDALKEWKEKGVLFIDNVRTKQKMPLYYQFYEDFIQNRQSLDISEAEKSLEIPHLLIHGTHDETVYLGEALHLMSLNEHVSLLKLQGATHTFGGYHPYDKQELPRDIVTALNYTVTFFQNE